MRNTLFSVVILCLASPFLVFSQHPAKNLNDKVAAYMENLQHLGAFSGVVLLARDGKVLFARGYGMANLEHDVPNSVDTKFRLGSITKQFTAVGIMMLQERKKLSVHDSICIYVHDCPDSWKSITIHQLLSHTSGIPSFTEFPSHGIIPYVLIIGTPTRFERGKQIGTYVVVADPDSPDPVPKLAESYFPASAGV
jgi:CubicO group peptidase (beta-lactamase class C family)